MDGYIEIYLMGENEVEVETMFKIVGTSAHKVYFKKDLFDQSKKGFLNETSESVSVVDFLKPLFPSEPVELYEKTLIKLLQKTFAQEKFNLLTLTQTVPYIFDCFLDPSLPKGTSSKEITAADLIEFCAHLRSMMMDIEATIPENSLEAYTRMGFLNDVGQSTALLRSGNLFDLLLKGQMQWDGMTPKLPLIIFQHLLTHLVLPHPVQGNDELKGFLVRFSETLQKTLYIKEIEETLISDMTKCRVLAKSILSSDGSVLIQGGHIGHTFYVEFRRTQTADSIHLSIIIHNFNGTALEFNRQVEKEENYFFPYAIQLTFPKKIGPKGKHNPAENEVNMVSAYIQLVLTAHCRGGELKKKGGALRSAEPGQVKILKHEERWLKRFYAQVWEKKDSLLKALKPVFLTPQGFSMVHLQAYLSDWKNLEKLFQQVFPDLFHSQDFAVKLLPLLKGNLYDVAEAIQTCVFLACIYQPWEHLNLLGLSLHPNPEHFLPYGLQRTGHCTVHNFKAGAFSSIGLDSRHPAHFEMLKSINIALKFTSSKWVSEFTPDFLMLLEAEPEAQLHQIVSPAEPLIKQGIAFYEAKKYKDAEAAFKEAMKLDPNHPIPFERLGMMIGEGDKHAGIKWYSQALDRIESDATIWVNRGILFAEIGEVERAEKDLSKAMSLNPNDVLAYVNRANVWVALNQWGKAGEDFTKAISLTPDDFFLYFQRGGVYATVQKKAEAISDFRLALSKGLSDFESLNIIRVFAVNTNNIALLRVALLKMKEVKPEEGLRIDAALAKLSSV